MAPAYRAAALPLATLILAAVAPACAPGVVTDAEWEGFLDSVVTPRFPAGFTVVEAEGHWRGATGMVEREQTEVVTLLHPGDEPSRRAVAELAAEYLRRFRQEAVLRERLTACAHF
jgi:hypothetical protein